MDDFNELRRLLLSREQEELRALRERLEDREQRARDVAGVLPQAAKLSGERGPELARAFQPMVGDSIRESIRTRPETFIDAFYPIIGPLVRRSIAESLRALMQSLNQTLEHTFSWQGLQWRWEALRTGRSFAEVVLLRSLVYRVEQIFLIHRETSLLLQHVTVDASAAKDSDLVAGMLSAIQDFSRDSFHSGADEALEEFRIGELQVWIAPGPKAYLAAVIRGAPPRELRLALEQAVENSHVLKGAALAAFAGDASIFEPLRSELEACLRAQYAHGPASGARLTKAWLALAGAAGLAIVAIALAARSELRWRDFLHRLSAEPGLAVTATRHHWLTRSRVAGLRDPLAADPAPAARQAGIDPARIQFEWKDYLALDAISIRRRIAQRFGSPAGARIGVRDGVLYVTGSAPYEWIERLRREGGQTPGVNSIAEHALRVTYDPARALARFRAAFPPPPGLLARVEHGALHLSGKAAYEWIAPVREGATHLPGIDAVAEDKLEVTFNPALVLRRFEDRFGLPDTVNATVQDGVLALSGEAGHAWLVRVRNGATAIPGVSALDERLLTDLDQVAFQQSKSVIESAFIYFLVGKDNFATEGFAALSRLPDEIRRCQTAAKRIGTEISVQICGSADAVGTESKNLELSDRRARAVRDFLVSCGLDGGMLKPLATPAQAAGGASAKPVPEESARRVAFRIILQS